MKRPSLRLSLLPALLLCSCSIVETTGTVRGNSPAPELGRPGWVRFCADVGSGVGTVVGGVASIVALPVTWPLSLLADEELGETGGDQFLFAPASTTAAFGHALFGWPADCLDWTFRRMWISRQQDPVLAVAMVPMSAPVLSRHEQPLEDSSPAK